jgi:protein-S-isoprenylcysteine O-methyltransferase Ste14
LSNITEKYVETVTNAAQTQRSEQYKATAGAVGAGVFLIVVPGILFGIGYWIYMHLVIPNVDLVRIVAAWISMLAGLFLLGWTYFSQVTIGKGTPNPIAPTHKLVVTGPYKWCRNPMQLGVMVYYFGIGSLLSSVWIGILMFFLALILGTIFHKLFEEKELKLRFGDQYEQYKAETPFLFPKIWSS